MVPRLENNSFSDQLQKWVTGERLYKTCVILKGIGSYRINKQYAEKCIWFDLFNWQDYILSLGFN